jgi:alkylation response protein AidB-like acyl-CoA dehydrogenase
MNREAARPLRVEVPAREEILAAAHRAATIAEAEAPESERDRRLTDKVVEALKRERLYRLLVPRALGGFETDLVTALEVARELARADGSTGWCFMAQVCWNSAVGAYMGDAAVAEIFAGANNADVVIAGQGMPSGRAEPVPGGYRVKGHWGYGSGISHAQYVQCGCVLTEGGKPRLKPNGMPVILLCAVRPEQIVLGDNWHVIGLRGTGSYDYDLRDVFVPEDYTYWADTTEPLRGGMIYTLGLKNTTALGHTAFALGMGRRALDELIAIAGSGKPSPYGSIGDSASFQQEFAIAEAKLRSIDAYCMDAWGAVQRTLDRGDQPELREIALVRVGTRYAHEVVAEVTSFAYKAAGGTSLRDSALQRCFRDVHAATQHVLVSHQIAQAAGKVLLGLAPPGAKWGLLGLE